MKIYRKEIMVKDWDSNFKTERVILDWTREEDYAGLSNLTYRDWVKEYERYIEVGEFNEAK